MKQRLGMLVVFGLVIAVLIGLNAASYTQKQKTPDGEIYPNRSSFNSGATGTQAWYTLLAETGRKVTRWQEPPASLLTTKTPPTVLVIVGAPRREITDKDAETLLMWVARGGRLVLIDREPPDDLVVTTANWKVALNMVPTREIFTVDPADRQQMTADVAAVHPIQPSILTQGVNAIQPSKFAPGISVEPQNGGTEQKKETYRGYGNPTLETEPAPVLSNGDTADEPRPAPVVHFAAGGKNVVVDVPFENGRITFVSDPYIVSNGGISLADNAKFATNLVASSGTIAFDEYHQGYSNDSNRFLSFFAGTPIVAIFLQGLVLVGLVFYSQSRRFARPLPPSEPNRLSKLEYVTAMAELQQRTRAWDLAIENIYTDFRRRAARLFGFDVNQATSDVLAQRIAERTDMDMQSLRVTLFKCEEIIRGEPTGKGEVVRLADSIREIERKLGLKRGRATK